jgi:hypothetical protein
MTIYLATVGVRHATVGIRQKQKRKGTGAQRIPEPIAALPDAESKDPADRIVNRVADDVPLPVYESMKALLSKVRSRCLAVDDAVLLYEGPGEGIPAQDIEFRFTTNGGPLVQPSSTRTLNLRTSIALSTRLNGLTPAPSNTCKKRPGELLARANPFQGVLGPACRLTKVNNQRRPGAARLLLDGSAAGAPR